MANAADAGHNTCGYSAHCMRSVCNQGRHNSTMNPKYKRDGICACVSSI